MDSYSADSLMKADRKTLAQRAKARERKANSVHLSALGSFEGELLQQSTDYVASPALNKLPMKVRERSRITEWPIEQRPNQVVYQPESRNLGGAIWRRWPNGMLAMDESLAHVEAAVMKLNRELSPLNEIEALMLCAVWPELKIANIPKHAVDIKAKISAKERDSIRDMVRVWPQAVARP